MSDSIKQSVFRCRSMKGRLSFGSAYNRARFEEFLKKHDGIILRIEPQYPESNKQRRFYQGAVIPMIAYYQEGMNHENPEDLYKIHEWLKMEFLSDFATLGGKSVKIAGSTQGVLNKGFLENVLAWMEDQGYKVEFLNPTLYKKWNDTIRSFGGPFNYIDYLVETGRLP